MYMIDSKISAGSIAKFGCTLVRKAKTEAAKLSSWLTKLAPGVLTSDNTRIVQALVDKLLNIESSWVQARLYFIPEGYPGVSYKLSVCAAVATATSFFKIRSYNY